MATSNSTSQKLSINPTAPPKMESNMLSVSIWRSDATAARAQRRADGDLFLPRGRASQKEIGDVRARDQEDAPNRAEENEERRPHRAHEPFVQDRQMRLPAFVRFVKRLPELRVDRVDLRLGLLQFDAGLHARDGGIGAVAARLVGEIHARGRPDLRVLRKLEAAG